MIVINSSQELVVYAGILLSLLVKYIPNFNAWYGKLRVTVRQCLMLSLLVGVVGLFFVGGCLGLTGVACDVASVRELALLLIVAIVGNQAAHAITPEVRSVKDSKTKFKIGSPFMARLEEGADGTLEVSPLSTSEQTALVASGIVVVVTVVTVALLSVFVGQ